MSWLLLRLVISMHGLNMKFVLKYSRYSGTHLSHKIPPHRTHVDGVYFLSYFSLNIHSTVWSNSLC